MTAHSSIQLMCGNGVSKMSFSSLPPLNANPGLVSTYKSVPNLPLASNLVHKIRVNNSQKVLKPSLIKQRHSANKLIRRVEAKVKKKYFSGFSKVIFSLNWIFCTNCNSSLTVYFLKGKVSHWKSFQKIEFWSYLFEFLRQNWK